MYIINTVGGLLLAAASLVALAEDHPAWTYEGEHGPSHWAQVDHNFAACESGRHESPINVDKAIPALAGYPHLAISYKKLPLDILNTGHAVQFQAQAHGGQIALGKTVYQLMQFHFHSPGEERFAGKSSDLDAHFVHKKCQRSISGAGCAIQCGYACQRGITKNCWIKFPPRRAKSKSWIIPRLIRWLYCPKNAAITLMMLANHAAVLGRGYLD